ncbi:MAG TPA: DUF4129 domain-containing protein, partial [Micromonospora sp.]
PDDDLPPGLPDYRPENLTPSFPPEPREIAGAEQTHIPEWVTTLAAVVGGGLLLTAVGWLLWLLLRDALRRRPTRALGTAPTRRRPAPQVTAEEVVAALDAGLDDLSDTDADPRRAVIACWVRLEQAAAAAGIPRRVGDTPTDLVTRMLTGDPHGGATVVSADVLATFAGVYRQARYATHAIDEQMRGQARDALHRLRAELTAGTGAGPA